LSLFSVLNQVAGPLHFVTPNGQEMSYQGDAGVLPVSIPFYSSAPHVQRNTEQRQNDKVIYYVPCHRENDEVRVSPALYFLTTNENLLEKKLFTKINYLKPFFNYKLKYSLP